MMLVTNANEQRDISSNACNDKDNEFAKCMTRKKGQRENEEFAEQTSEASTEDSCTAVVANGNDHDTCAIAHASESATGPTLLHAPYLDEKTHFALKSVCNKVQATDVDRRPGLRSRMALCCTAASKHDWSDHHHTPSCGTGAFAIVNLSALVDRIKLWQLGFPNVCIRYPVKVNPDPAMMELLASLGHGFDCASEGEIDAALRVGGKPENMIFSHTIKRPEAMCRARCVGIPYSIIDSVDELRKHAIHWPEAKLLIRLAVPDIRADDQNDDEDLLRDSFKLGNKFGATLEEIPELLQVGISELGLQLVGCHFHVGSLAPSAKPYVAALQMAKQVFQMVRKFENTNFHASGHNSGSKNSFHVINLGGGFHCEKQYVTEDQFAQDENWKTTNPIGSTWGTCTNSERTFLDLAKTLRAELASGFNIDDHQPQQPQPQQLVVLAEPGTFLAGATTSMAVSIASVKRNRFWVWESSYGVLKGLTWPGYNDILARSISTIKKMASRKSEHIKTKSENVDEEKSSVDIIRPTTSINDLGSKAGAATNIRAPCNICDLDNIKVTVGVTHLVQKASSEKTPSTILHGITCDWEDDLELPNIHLQEPQSQLTSGEIHDVEKPLAVGDLFFFENMGAYTLSCACDFNGFRFASMPKVYITDHRRRSGFFVDICIKPISKEIGVGIVLQEPVKKGQKIYELMNEGESHIFHTESSCRERLQKLESLDEKRFFLNHIFVSNFRNSNLQCGNNNEEGDGQKDSDGHCPQFLNSEIKMIELIGDGLYWNHSTAPSVHSLDGGRTWIATKDLEVGDELKYDCPTYENPQWYVELCKEHEVSCSQDCALP